MCMSPHEMSDERIEHAIEQMKRWIADGQTYYQWRLDEFERVMTERTQAKLDAAPEVGAAIDEFIESRDTDVVRFRHSKAI